MNSDLTTQAVTLLNMTKGISVSLLTILAALPIQAWSSERVDCTTKEVTRILNLNEPKGRGRILAASTVNSTEGSSWLIKGKRGKVAFLRRTDYGESGKAQTDYLFLRKNMFLAKQETYAYAEPIYINKAVVPKLIQSNFFVMCKGQAWIPVRKDESADIQKMREPWDTQSQIEAPELAGLVFGIE